jgi:CBS domain-containing membrane protein
MPHTDPATSSLSPQTSSRMPEWLRDFLPARMAVNARERWRVAAGAAVGLLLTAWLYPVLTGNAALSPWLIAPMGASAVLVFGLPASPLAQPWSVVGGNTVSALVGIACVHLFGSGPLAAALAVGLAIAAMFALRCLHPPGGASALLVVLLAVHDPRFALAPVFANSLLLALAGIAYNNATGRRYPHRQRPSATPAALSAPTISEADLDAVLARYNQVLDVSRDDLQQLLSQAELHAYQRRLGELRCADIMSRDLATVEYGTSLQDAWALLRERRIKALPVIDKVRRVVGIVTLADFMRHADLDLHHGWADRLRTLIRPSHTTHADKPEAVGQIMVRQVRVASADRPLSELVPLFADTGHHHIPIIDGERRLVGIITQSDLVAALCRTA